MMKIKVKVKDRIHYGSKVQITYAHRDLATSFKEGGEFSLNTTYELVSDAFLIFKEDNLGNRKNGWSRVKYNPITGECKEKIKILAKIKLVE